MIRNLWLTKFGAALGLAVACGALSSSAHAANDKARISALADVAFGTVSTSTDTPMSQDVCAYSSSATNGYSVTATGSGGGGAFTLSSGAAQLPYDVLWADSVGQPNGTALTTGATASGFISTAGQQGCSNPTASATLTVVIRAASLGSALAGSYTGSLQITIAPQ